MQLTSVTYDADGPVARITLNRPRHANAIDLAMPEEIAYCVERANLDPRVRVIAVSGNGPGFCGGYDLQLWAEGRGAAPDTESEAAPDAAPDTAPGAEADLLRRYAENSRPDRPWDPTIDYQLLSRMIRGFMTLFHSEKPTVCKVHGFCVAGGTDIALCADLLVIAADAKIGYPPTRVWGIPAAGLWAHRIGVQRAKRLLFTGDSLSGQEAAEWGLAIEAPSAEQLDERFEALLQRIARLPTNQLILAKLALNLPLHAQGLAASQTISTVFDGIARHTPEGHAFAEHARRAGFRQAVHDRDKPFGDLGRSTNKQ